MTKNEIDLARRFREALQSSQYALVNPAQARGTEAEYAGKALVDWFEEFVGYIDELEEVSKNQREYLSGVIESRSELFIKNKELKMRLSVIRDISNNEGLQLDSRLHCIRAQIDDILEDKRNSPAETINAKQFEGFTRLAIERHEHGVCSDTPSCLLCYLELQKKVRNFPA